MTTDAHTPKFTGAVAQMDPSARETGYTAPGAPGAPGEPGQAYAPQQPYAPQFEAPQAQQPVNPQLAPGKHAYGFSIASFVLGIASIISGWTLIAPVVGLVLGSIALKRNTPERTLALWGVWLNAAILALAALGIILMILLASFGVFTGVASGAFAAFAA
ncbi:hypothetical protein [Leucobacter komagatae]|uniref:hypothetical protein n=1 Tax=Leucobacter komagatae TaxID=55969 RepID=UPI000ADE5836|nr:hypothetical protein [Leucobacter komagatae]